MRVKPLNIIKGGRAEREQEGGRNECLREAGKTRKGQKKGDEGARA